MKFLDQYELLEPVTGGPVETFTARDLKTGERLVVHLFAIPGSTADQVRAQEALQVFSRIAPAPLGRVLAGGRYEQTSYAYLIAAMPAEASAVRDWVRSYEIQVRTMKPTAEPVASSSKSLAGDPHSPGEFTRAFLSAATADFDAMLDHGSGDSWSNRPAGPFTKEFLSGYEQGGPGKMAKVSPATPLEKVSFTAEFLVGRPPSPPSFLADWGSFSSAKDVPEPKAAAPSQEPAGTGEFTRFFSGPFGGDKGVPEAPAEGLDFSSSTPKQKQIGEFTRIFGPVDKAPMDAGLSLNELPSSDLPEPFEKNLERPQDLQLGPEFAQRSLPEASPAWNREINWDGVASDSPAVQSQAGSGKGFSAAEKNNSGRVPPGFDSREAGATEVFRPGRPLQETPPARKGPGEYTRIISARPGPAATQDAMPPAKPAEGAMPPTPAPPAAAMPAPMPAPPKPDVQAPAAPKVNPPAAGRGKMTSYLPVIIVMNLLLILAIALVLFFALKH